MLDDEKGMSVGERLEKYDTGITVHSRTCICVK